MKVKTADLIGPALDWAVAKCGAVDVEYINNGITRCLLLASPFTGVYSPSTDWSQGGPIIERERINVKSNLARMREHPEYDWLSDCPEKRICVSFSGHTPLIAAMRCYCCAKLGEYVDVPEELCQRANS